MSLKKNTTAGKFGPKLTAAEDPPTQETSVRSGFTTVSEQTKKLTVLFDAQLHRELKIIATQQGTTMREILEQLASDYVDQHRDNIR